MYVVNFIISVSFTELTIKGKQEVKDQTDIEVSVNH